MLPKTREKKSRVYFSSFLGVNLTNFFCEVNLKFFLEIFISRVFFPLSFTSTKSRDFLCIEFLELFSLSKHHLSSLITMHLFPPHSCCSSIKKMMRLKRQVVGYRSRARKGGYMLQEVKLLRKNIGIKVVVRRPRTTVACSTRHQLEDENIVFSLSKCPPPLTMHFFQILKERMNSIGVIDDADPASTFKDETCKAAITSQYQNLWEQKVKFISEVKYGGSLGKTCFMKTDTML